MSTNPSSPPPEAHPGTPTLKQAAVTATNRSVLLGAIFLMATSAIGSGFLIQSAVFTNQLRAAFAFAIIVSILIDIAVQMNVWRVIGIAGMRAQDLANRVLPGYGWAMSALITTGGVVFNIGNIAGAGLGMNAMFGVDPKLSGLVTAGLALLLFTSKKAGMALDKILVILGFIMLSLALYVAVVSNPPVGDALKNAVLPEEIDWLVITTLVGGTVGGFITYAGAHRMLDSGETGPAHVRPVAISATTGILLTGLMRVLLFLAVLGVVAGGVVLNEEGNPMAQVFQAATGDIGMQLFGLVLWAAAVSSMIGCSYNSASFLVSQHESKRKLQNWLTVGLLVIAGIFVAFLGTAPTTMIVFAGAFNGLVLPMGFTMIMYVAIFRQKDLLFGYRYPKWLIAFGGVGVIVSWFLAWVSFESVFALL